MSKRLMLTELACNLPWVPDLFICCASYETRCLSIANAVKEKVNRALVVSNKNLEQYVSSNRNLMLNMLPNSTAVVGDSSSPILTLDNLRCALDSLSGIKRVLLDITTFTHEQLLMILRLLSMNSEFEVLLAYASASDYSSKLPLEKKWLSKGIRDIRSVLGFPGDLDPTLPTQLIVLVGFEHERAAKLIEAYEPADLYIGHGHPSGHIDDKHKNANLHFSKLVEDTAAVLPVVNSFEFICSSPSKVKDALEKCINNSPEHNHVIAPMNTKLSTVGCAMLALESESVQLCYAEPYIYNYDNYSHPGSACYLTSFDLGGAG